MKIQQHDGVVVDAGRHSSRASPILRERDVTGEREVPKGCGMMSLAHKGQGAPPTAHVAPRRRWTPQWTPGPLSALPVQYR